MLKLIQHALVTDGQMKRHRHRAIANTVLAQHHASKNLCQLTRKINKWSKKIKRQLTNPSSYEK